MNQFRVFIYSFSFHFLLRSFRCFFFAIFSPRFFDSFFSFFFLATIMIYVGPYVLNSFHDNKNAISLFIFDLFLFVISILILFFFCHYICECLGRRKKKYELLNHWKYISSHLFDAIYCRMQKLFTFSLFIHRLSGFCVSWCVFFLYFISIEMW